MPETMPAAVSRPTRRRGISPLVTALLLVGGVTWPACQPEDTSSAQAPPPSATGDSAPSPSLDWSATPLAELRVQGDVARLAQSQLTIPPNLQSPAEVQGWLRASLLAGGLTLAQAEETIGQLAAPEHPEAVAFLRWWAACELAGEPLDQDRQQQLLLEQTHWQLLPADQQADGLAQLVRFFSHGMAGLSLPEQKAALFHGLSLAATLRQVQALLPACDHFMAGWMDERKFKEVSELLDHLEKLAAGPEHDPDQDALRTAVAQRVAGFHFRRRAFALAQDKLEPFLTEGATSEALLLGARIAWENQQPEKAQAWVERLLGPNPLALAVENPALAASAHFLLGRCLRKSGRWVEALSHFEQATQLWPPPADSPVDNPEQDALTWEKGSTLAALERYAEASAVLESLALRRRKKLDDAVRPAAPFLELARLSGELAAVEEKLGQRDRAIQSYREKLRCEEAALERTFRTDSIQQEMVRTRAHIARLLATPTDEETSLADNWKALSEQLLLAPEAREIQDTWLATLQRYASRQIAAGEASTLPSLFQQATTVLDAVAATGASPAQLDWLKIRLFWEQTAILEKAGLAEPAAEALLHAQAILDGWPSERPLEDALRTDLVHALLDKADGFFAQLRLRDAHQIVQQARRFVPPREGGDPLRVLVLCGLAKIQLARGLEEPALEFLRVATEETDAMPEGPDRTLLQLEVARQRAAAQLRLGNAPTALSIVENALALATTRLPESSDGEEERRSLAGLWGMAAEAHLRAQDWKQARSALETQQIFLLQMVRSAFGGEDRDLQLLRNYRLLASTMQQLGEADRALRLVEAASRLAASDRPAALNAARVIEEVELHILAIQLHRQNKMLAQADADGTRALALLEEPVLRSAVPFEQQRWLAAQVWREIARTREEEPGQDVLEALQQTYRALLDASPQPVLAMDEAINPRALAGRLADLWLTRGNLAQAYFWRLEQRRLLDSSLRSYPHHRGLSQEWVRTVLQIVDAALTQSLWAEAESGLDEVLDRLTEMNAHGVDLTETAAWELQALRLTARLYAHQTEWSSAWDASQDAWLAWQRLPPAAQQREDVRREVLLNLAAAKSLADRENRQNEWQNMLFSFRVIREWGFPGSPSAWPEVSLAWALLENLAND